MNIVDRSLKIFKCVMRGINQLGRSGYIIFTASILTSSYKLSNKEVNDVLDILLDKGYISRIYRVYNPNNFSQYVDFKHKNDIPFNHHVYDSNTEEEFYIDRDDGIKIYYFITPLYLRKLKNHDDPKGHSVKRGLDKETNDVARKGRRITNSFIFNIYINKRKGFTVNGSHNNVNSNNNNVNSNINSNNKNNSDNQKSISFNHINQDLDNLAKNLNNSKYIGDIEKAREAFKGNDPHKSIKWLKKIFNGLKNVASSISIVKAVKYLIIVIKSYSLL